MTAVPRRASRARKPWSTPDPSREIRPPPRATKGHAVPIHLAVLRATEILDSRSRPTLSVGAGLPDGRSVRAGVPSGATTTAGPG